MRRRSWPASRAERFIRTLKDLLWVRCFATVEELRQALHAFKDTYNRTWIVERHGYQTPAAVRAAQLDPLPVAAWIRNAVSHKCGPLQAR
jgi:putative transposase